MGFCLTMEKFIVHQNLNEEELSQMLEPLIEGEGFELVQIRVRRAQSRSLITLYVDKKDSSVGITIDEIEFLSRFLLDILEAKAENLLVLSGPYQLEVSSPGLDRPLCKMSHFEKAIGSKVKIRFKSDAGHIHSHFGKLIKVFDDGIEIDDDSYHEDNSKNKRKIPFSIIVEANTLFEFGNIGDKAQKKNKN